MDYHKIYNELISNRRLNPASGYTENHHILPKCLGGSDDSENLVALTPEEHYVAHQLLVKMYPDNDSLIYAAQMMIPNRPSNKLYGWLKRRHSNLCKKRIGKFNGAYGTRWICNITLQENKKISKDDVIPEGWIAGRNKWVKPKKRNRKKLRESNGLTNAQNQRILRQTKQYNIDGIIITGLKPICEKYDITHPAVIHRLKSDKFPTWKPDW